MEPYSVHIESVPVTQTAELMIHYFHQSDGCPVSHFERCRLGMGISAEVLLVKTWSFLEQYTSKQA